MSQLFHHFVTCKSVCYLLTALYFCDKKLSRKFTLRIHKSTWDWKKSNKHAFPHNYNLWFMDDFICNRGISLKDVYSNIVEHRFSNLGTGYFFNYLAIVVEIPTTSLYCTRAKYFFWCNWLSGQSFLLRPGCPLKYFVCPNCISPHALQNFYFLNIYIQVTSRHSQSDWCCILLTSFDRKFVLYRACIRKLCDDILHWIIYFPIIYMNIFWK